MRLQLLVDSGEFARSLRADVPTARHRVFVQALTVEGDAAGQQIAGLLRASTAPDRRLAIDHFTNWKISDKWIHDPRHLLDAPLRAEVRATRRMVDGLRHAGVAVTFTNPVGFLGLRLPRRNHKKLVIVDDRIAYIGGINFSDHNFAWHDVMLRIEDSAIASFLAADFESTWGGADQWAARTFPGIDLYVLDGRHNAELFAPLFALLDGARRRIDVHCCYLTPPFSGRLQAARQRGVRVRVLVPAANNWSSVNGHVEHALGRAGIEVRQYRGRMSHLKTMLVDGEALVVGSANFDFLSYRFQQEVMAIVRDPGVIADYTNRVFETDFPLARPAATRSWRVGPAFAHWSVELLAGLAQQRVFGRALIGEAHP